MFLFSEWMSSIHWIRLQGQIVTTGGCSCVSLPQWNSSGWTSVENKWERGMMNAVNSEQRKKKKQARKKKSQAFKQFKCWIRFLNLVWPSKTGSCLTGKLWGAPYAWKIIKWDRAFQDSYLHYGAQSRNSSMTEATLFSFLLENLCSAC